MGLLIYLLLLCLNINTGSLVMFTWSHHYQPCVLTTINPVSTSDWCRSKDAGDSVMTPGVLQSMSILFIVCIIIFRFDDQSLRLPNHDTSAIINNSNTASHDSCALCSEEGCLQ